MARFESREAEWRAYLEGTHPMIWFGVGSSD